MWLFALLLASASLLAQQNGPAASSPPIGAAVLPNLVISGGGGFASPNGKFAYASVSKLLDAATYSTSAQEYSLVGKTVQSCTLTGLSKMLYTFGAMTAGITGMGGGCAAGSAIGEAQGFLDIRYRQSNWGVAVTAMKTTNGGFKVTIAPRWAK